MKGLAAAVVGLGLGLFGLSAAQAAPASPAVLQGTGGAEIIQVAQGCGPGFHRGPRGACRPLYNCPPGWHTGPYGKRCFRNW
ncbi:conserved hypothetical protein [Bradyrhizobium sp. ORS 278]|uniref:GCG_CRPN prefix-to-repeats domain-containing protein n=1 Tax=Bradyrhizobium sp. (strain ORS 278) TaxID=114615 RepID=UPI0001507F3E|nr:hypothetical protein [Bradyrhizobium sp. ORS 278]CAL78074.1 conserved hypothetical protein [Bradyrhizobium sp. ORS 278]